MAKNDNLGDFLKSLADKFRLKISNTAKINPQDFEKKVDEVFDAGSSVGYSEGWLSGVRDGVTQGKQEAYDTFWDNYQSNGNRTIYEFGFAREGWTNATFNPKYDITVDMDDSSNMFSYSRITGSLKTILNQNGVSLTFHNDGNTSGPRYMFVGTKFTELPELDFSAARGSQALASTFSGSALIETIEKIILPDSCTGYGTNTFYACRALQNINFEGTIKYSLDFKDCPLSADSMKNIFDHLDTNPVADARTITIKQIVKDSYITKYGETEWNNNITLYTGPTPGWSFVIK